MNVVTFGSLTARAHEAGVRFEVAAADCVELSPREVGALASFLTRQRWDETRTGFRVPVHALMRELADLKVTLVHQGTIYDCETLDLSLTGMLVRCDAMTAGANLQVEARLVLEDELARLPAEVVRSSNGLVALHFTESMAGGELNPPEDLVSLFRRIERYYLRSRSEED